MTAPPDIYARAAAVRLLLLDVDGVLTDGCLYFGAGGEACKVFHVRDGHGLVLLARAGCRVAVASGRDSPIVTARMRELGVTDIHQHVTDKAALLAELLSDLDLAADAVCYVGDDLPDLGILRRVGLAVAVADAHPTVRAAAHWQTESGGGRGAVREVCDLLIEARGRLDLLR